MTDSSLHTLVVGVDSACMPVLERLFEDDCAPTLEGLVDDGVAGPLASRVPPWTPSAWPTLYTGVNPGKHGVFGFLDFDGYDYDVVNATDVSEFSMWELLDRYDQTSVVVNVPVTHPPSNFDGALVPGYLAPEDPGCHPEGVLAEIRDELGDYRVYADTNCADEPVEEYTDVVGMRGEAFRYLADRHDPEFGFLQFQLTDKVFHERPGDWDAVRAVYEAFDDELEATLAATDPDRVFVVSDHGMGEYDGHSFYVNEFLADHGFVETTRDGNGMPSWVPIRENKLRDGEADGAPEGGWSARAVHAASTLGLTTTRAGRVLDAVGLRDVVARHVPGQAVRAGSRQVDFANSTAYMRSRIELGVRINLQGREPDGVVPPGKYDTVRRELIDLLEDVTTPDGDPVFDDVAPREEYFDGPESQGAVDVVTVPAQYNNFLSADLVGTTFDDPAQPWNHKLDGLFVAAGEDVQDVPAPDDMHIEDVAPTVLSALGVPRNKRMDGDTLPMVDPTEERAYPSYGSEDRRGSDTSNVEQRLADLGYLE